MAVSHGRLAPAGLAEGAAFAAFVAVVTGRPAFLDTRAAALRDDEALDMAVDFHSYQAAGYFSMIVALHDPLG